MGRERRTAERYVIGSLLMDLGGMVHETLDVSKCAVAVLRQSTCDYSKLNVPARFFSETQPELNQSIARLSYIAQRSGVIVLGYTADNPEWEHVLQTHDVRFDMKQLEDVFG